VGEKVKTTAMLNEKERERKKEKEGEIQKPLQIKSTLF